MVHTSPAKNGHYYPYKRQDGAAAAISRQGWGGGGDGGKSTQPTIIVKRFEYGPIKRGGGGGGVSPRPPEIAAHGGRGHLEEYMLFCTRYLLIIEAGTPLCLRLTLGATDKLG